MQGQDTNPCEFVDGRVTDNTEGTTRKPACVRFYLALAGGTMPFIRRYSTIWP